jgi:hypothetical protein
MQCFAGKELKKPMPCLQLKSIFGKRVQGRTDFSPFFPVDRSTE